MTPSWGRSWSRRMAVRSTISRAARTARSAVRRLPAVLVPAAGGEGHQGRGRGARPQDGHRSDQARCRPDAAHLQAPAALYLCRGPAGAEDQQAGQTRGQGFKDFGGVWLVATVKPPRSTGSSSGGNGGWMHVVAAALIVGLLSAFARAPGRGA